MSGRDFKILVTGSRDWWNEKAIRLGLLDARRLLADAVLDSEITLIHGAARGADRLADFVARDWGWKIVAMPANWASLGKRAGPMRNAEMLELKPDICVAFLRADLPCKGTRDMMERCYKAGVPVLVVTR